MTVIGLVGLKGSGKDTVGRYLSQRYRFTDISFADSLKDCLSSIFHWDRFLLEGRTKRSREWREKVDPWWSAELGIPDFTPRMAMTEFGTDIMRKHFHNDIWVMGTKRKIQNTPSDIVVTDCRFPNELQMIRDMHGIIIRVNRGALPAWHNTALAALGGDEEAALLMSEQYGVHISEWALTDAPVDYIVHNNYDLAALYRRIDSIMASQ
jgi:hypothetical protein